MMIRLYRIRLAIERRLGTDRIHPQCIKGWLMFHKQRSSHKSTHQIVSIEHLILTHGQRFQHW